MIKTKTHLILMVVLSLFVYTLMGCNGPFTTPDSSNALTGALAPKESQENGGTLYQKYKNRFPQNLMSMKSDDFRAMLPSYIIQNADGTEAVAFAPHDVVYDIVKQVKRSIPLLT